MEKWWTTFKAMPLLQPLFRKEAAHLASGRWGEKLAAKHLKKAGYRVVGSRVRVGRHDEIDLIVYAKRVLIFVEVKTRKNERYGRPIDAVNRAKRKNLSRAAIRYIKQLPAPPDYLRFDVVEVVGTPADGVKALRHIENAFPLDPAYTIWW